MNRIDMTEFRWQSQAQEKGYGAFVQFCRSHDKDPQFDEIPTQLLAAYLIQKEHEAQEWWTRTMGDAITRLENELSSLRAELNSLRKPQTG